MAFKNVFQVFYGHLDNNDQNDKAPGIKDALLNHQEIGIKQFLIWNG